jgi:hypothetical protein
MVDRDDRTAGIHGIASGHSVRPLVDRRHLCRGLHPRSSGYRDPAMCACSLVTGFRVRGRESRTLSCRGVALRRRWPMGHCGWGDHVEALAPRGCRAGTQGEGLRWGYERALRR